jgi:hypothetical protein
MATNPELFIKVCSCNRDCPTVFAHAEPISSVPAVIMKQTFLAGPEFLSLMRGEDTKTTHEQLPLFLLTLHQEDISVLLENKSLVCSIPGRLDNRPIELALYGVYASIGAKPGCVFNPWFEAQVYGRIPFYMFVPNNSEALLRAHVTSHPFQIRTTYLATRTSAFARIRIAAD